jgi:hypothetical protein
MAPLLLVLLSALALAAAPAQGISVVVSNGYETHAALTSPEVTWMLIAGNVRGVVGFMEGIPAGSWPGVVGRTAAASSATSSMGAVQAAAHDAFLWAFTACCTAETFKVT